MRTTIRAILARLAGPAGARRGGPRRTRVRAIATAVVLAAAVGTGTAVLTGAAGPVDPGPVDADRSRPEAAVVWTAAGAVRGSVAADHRSFAGIPYAAPPVGHRRWTSPQPVPPWSGVRDATRPGAACAQLPGLPMDRQSDSEDCLYLNVTTPTARPGAKLPVMVWLHGGHFLFGQGDTYPGRSLAVPGQVVVVTLNYRLGPLGFLAHPALDRGPGQPTSGTFGLEDQQAALRWVRENAAAFGGDPGNVTLFGQSAGATSVCAHLAAPASAGLFDRVVMQSNSCTSPLPGRQEAERQGAALAGELGCADHPAGVADCLRDRSPAELLAKAGYPGLGFDSGPSAGGSVLPVDPARALATGRFHRVPVLTGVTSDEYRAQLWGMERSGANCPDGPGSGRCALTERQYQEQLTATFGAKASAVRDRYPRGDHGSASEALAAVLTDFEYVRPTLDAAARFAEYVPSFVYEFADPYAPWFAAEPVPSFPTGAYHLAELPYLFDVGYAEPLDAGQRRLADQLVRYWTRFAHTGDPNGPGSPGWSPYDERSRYVQSLAPGQGGIRRTDLAGEHRYDFWRLLD
ncbi:carboxylesterase family protein [Plantactinospora mayteni]|uniref:Carboxylic ester hydrolase n=1 Tax=Plantactinospora mayteni TaxID=566021 RepID=A0ABQ4EIM1_9ACTN|nr:carboxylesterase family protein [Plantactinospora mayteni]GIG94052.1 carboxylic ester hydrolase [Plantactinospora mayteni]